MRRFLKVQPLATMQQSHQQVIVMLEPAFCSGHHRVITLLCDMLRAIYKPFPVPSATQPAELPKEVHVRTLMQARRKDISLCVLAKSSCIDGEWTCIRYLVKGCTVTEP